MPTSLHALRAWTLGMLCLAGVGAQAFSVSIPKLLIDSALAKKFPKEKYSVQLDNPTLVFSKARQKIELCGKWSSKLAQRTGDFCLDFEPQWKKDTGEITIAKVKLLKLNAGEESTLPPQVASALNASVMQLLDGTAVYKVPDTVGKHLEGLEVQDNSISLKF